MASKKSEKKEVAVVEKTAEVDIKKKSSVMVRSVNRIVELGIHNDDHMAEAGALKVNIKKFEKYVTQEKKKQLDPANETVRAIKNFWSPFEIEIKNAFAGLDKVMIAYHDRVEADRKKKEESIVAREEKGQLKEETAVNKLAELGEEKKTMHTGEGSVTFTKIKKVRFADPKKIAIDSMASLAYLVNGGYLVWDEVRARKDALAGIQVPGVEVYEETSTNTRA